MYNHLIIANLKRGVNLKISVLGCGRWGSFIAWYLDKIGHEVKMWGRRDSHHLQEIKTLRRNSYLKFPKSINVTDDLEECLKFSNTIIISISAQSLRTFSESLNALGINLNEKTFVLCMKGIEENTGKRLSQVIKESIFYKINIAIWVGPGHVQDFAGGIPNCMVIDSENNSVKNYLVENFSSNIIRFYYGTDLLGNEIGAAAKNVMGIAAGILDGMNYESLKGALMSRGTREIARLIKAMGGSEMSAYGLAHLGDRAAEPAHRQRQLPRVADKCQIHTQGNLPGHAQVHAQHDDGEHLQDAHHVAQCVKRGHPVAQPEPQVGVAVVLLAELVKLRLLPAERAHHAHAGQVLLHNGGQLALGLVRLGETGEQVGGDFFQFVKKAHSFLLK